MHINKIYIILCLGVTIFALFSDMIAKCLRNVCDTLGDGCEMFATRLRHVCDTLGTVVMVVMVVMVFIFLMFHV